jgi:hypothetical protein
MESATPEWVLYANVSPEDGCFPVITITKSGGLLVNWLAFFDCVGWLSWGFFDCALIQLGVFTIFGSSRRMEGLREIPRSAAVIF